MVLTFIILALTVALFVWGRLRADVVALLSLLALFLAGILDADQALAGFSNSTVVMIAALFVVGEGLSQTGVTAWFGERMLAAAGTNQLRLLFVLMVGTALLSAFVSNTGTVATLMPAVVSIAWKIGSVPSKLLMPVAFAANIGGILTLTGTPPNIVVAGVLDEAGFAPFGYFEFAKVGLPLLGAALVYMAFYGRRLLPERTTGQRPVDLLTAMHEMADDYALDGDLYRLRVRRGSDLIGRTLEEVNLGREYNVSILDVDPFVAEAHRSRRRRFQRNLAALQGDGSAAIPGPQTRLGSHDILLVRGERTNVERLMAAYNLGIRPHAVTDKELASTFVTQEVGLAEVLIAVRSDHRGRTIPDLRFFERFRVQVLSVRHRGRTADLQTTRLRFGDTLLVRGTWEAIELLRQDYRNFVVLGSPEAMAGQVVTLSPRALISMAALIGMIAMMVSGVVPTVMAAIIAAIAIVLGGCVSVQGAYRAISWGSVVLIAAMIPMSTALQITGGADFLAGSLVASLGELHPLVLMAGIFLLTTGFSQVISNTATTVLVAPIVLQTALDLGISPYPLLMVVAISASTAFLTPIGTTTNVMVTAPGGYTFSDFIRVGGPLLLIFLILTLILVPMTWPL